MIRQLRHKIKLLWLKRKWVIQSVYNTKEFSNAKFLLNLEKKAVGSYHEALRGKDSEEIAKAAGRLEVFERIKEGVKQWH